MERLRYVSGDVVSLTQYLPEDDRGSYANWQDPDTQLGFNYVVKESFEEYCARRAIQHRFIAVVMLNTTGEIVGTIALSPEGTLPDLAIWIYKPYRNQGYGTEAFSLGAKYCFDSLHLDTIYAGCYPHNTASQKMLLQCGFKPHPEGDLEEHHIITGEPVIQYDFVLHNPKSQTPAQINL